MKNHCLMALCKLDKLRILKLRGCHRFPIDNCSSRLSLYLLLALCVDHLVSGSFQHGSDGCKCNSAGMVPDQSFQEKAMISLGPEKVRHDGHLTHCGVIGVGRYRPDICHEYHELYSWRKNCHVEKN